MTDTLTFNHGRPVAKPIDQVGAIPYLIEDGIPRFVLITPKHANRIWIVPKGHIESELGPKASAEFEALEEAGVIGKIKGKPIGTYTYEKLNRTYAVSIYRLRVEKVLDSWNEESARKRCIVKHKKAVQLINHSELAKMITAIARKAEKRR